MAPGDLFDDFMFALLPIPFVVFNSLFIRPLVLLDIYGPPGLIFWLVGSRTTWRMQVQVLGKLDDKESLEFKKSLQDGCTMVSIAAAIVAQIAITALALDYVSRTHWVTRALWIFSLTAALMSVYYATRQHRGVGKLLHPKQIRAWIRGRKPRFLKGISYSPYFLRRVKLPLFEVPYLAGDPDEFIQEHLRFRSADTLMRALAKQCFTPGIASVIAMSAPQVLLSASLGSLLIGLGTYVGFIWTRNLDQDAGPNDSRNVFICYITGLVVCSLIYSLSGLIQEGDWRVEDQVIDSYARDYLRNHPPVAQTTAQNSRRNSSRQDTEPIAASMTPTAATEAGVESATTVSQE